MQDFALIAAGIVGILTAVIHGILMQKHMVAPIVRAMAEGRAMPSSTRRLIPILMHFSTFCWLAGGVLLVAAAFCPDAEARLPVVLCVAAIYAYGMIGNAWATRGRHPGWMLLAVALALIAVAIV